MPGSSWTDIFLSIDAHRNQPGPFTQLELRFFQSRFEKPKPILMRASLLPVLLPVHGMVVQKQRAVILLYLLAGAPAILELVLDEFQVNGRCNGFSRFGCRAHMIDNGDMACCRCEMRFPASAKAFCKTPANAES